MVKAMSEQKYCSVCKKCSGCQLSNMDYPRQLKYKQNELRVRFNRLHKTEKILGAENPLNYRNKALFVFKRVKGQVQSGIYQSTDRTVVLTKDCALHTKEQNNCAKVLCRLFDKFKVDPYDFYKQKGLLKCVFIRQSFKTGELMVVLVCDQRRNFPKKEEFTKLMTKEVPEVASVIFTTHKGNTLTAGENPQVLFGKSHITDSICGLDFTIGYNSFFQINPKQTEVLYKTAISLAELTKEDTVLDAYSGTGTIGMICSPYCKEVYSVELNENAVADAKVNARINNIENVNLVCADSQDYIKKLQKNKTDINTALLDPPRAGCSKSFLATLCNLAPKKIVYISCNIDTQLRDVRYLLKRGYEIKKVQGVDMFPYTKHIESIVLLTLK